MPSDTKILVEVAILALKKFTVAELCEHTNLRRDQVDPVLAQLKKDEFVISAGPDVNGAQAVPHRRARCYQVTTDVAKRQELANRVYRLRRVLASPRHPQNEGVLEYKANIEDLENLLDICDSATTYQPLTKVQLQGVERQLHSVYVQLKTDTYQQATDLRLPETDPLPVVEHWERWKSCNDLLYRIVARWKEGEVHEFQEQVALPPNEEGSKEAPQSFADRTYKSLMRFASLLEELGSDEPNAEFIYKVSQDSWEVNLVYSSRYPSQGGLRGAFSFDFRHYLVTQLKSLGYPEDKISELETTSFEEVKRTGLSERKKAIFCMPYLIPMTKWIDEAVIQFGWHRRFGIAYVEQGYGKKRVELHGSRVILERIAFEAVCKKFVKKNTIVYSPENYSIREIVRTNLARLGNEVKTIEGVVPTAGNGDKIPQEVVNHATSVGENWIFAFDLGDYESVKNHLESLISDHGPIFRDVKIVEAEHNELVPVGIGFTVYAAPLLLRNNLWEILLDAVQKYLTPDAINELRQVGVDVDTSIINDTSGSLGPKKTSSYISNVTKTKH